MANRRMISKDVVESMPFLQMTLSSQALYMHLMLNADDDGIVNAFVVMRMTGATPGELDNLLRQGFVRWVIEDEQLLIIKDFLAQNTIQNTRYTASRYRGIAKNKYPELIRIRPGLDDLDNCRQDVDKLSANCRQVDGTIQYSTGKVSLDKYSIVQHSVEGVDNLSVDKSELRRYMEKAELLKIKKEDAAAIVKMYGLDCAMKYLHELDCQVGRISIDNPGGWLRAACEKKYNLDDKNKE